MEQSPQPNNDLHTAGRRLPSGLLVCHDAEREQSMMDGNLHKRSLRLRLALHRAWQCAQCCRHPTPAPAPRIAQAQTSTRKCGFRGFIGQEVRCEPRARTATAAQSRRIIDRLDLPFDTLIYTSTMSFFKLKTNAATSSHSRWGTCKAFMVAPAWPRKTDQSLSLIFMPLCEVFISRPV